eukprot:979177-Amphidinium_carterae.1
MGFELHPLTPESPLKVSTMAWLLPWSCLRVLRLRPKYPQRKRELHPKRPVLERAFQWPASEVQHAEQWQTSCNSLLPSGGIHATSRNIFDINSYLSRVA